MPWQLLLLLGLLQVFASSGFCFWRRFVFLSCQLLLRGAGAGAAAAGLGSALKVSTNFVSHQFWNEFLDVHGDAAFSDLNTFNVEGFFRHVYG